MVTEDNLGLHVPFGIPQRSRSSAVCLTLLVLAYIMEMAINRMNYGGLLLFYGLLCDTEEGMARPLRIEYPNAWYHVMNRGRREEDIFSDRTDCEIFLGVLQESSELFGFRAAAFCLMSNHYHLLLQTPLGKLSRVMRHVNGVYTQRYNRRQKVDGQLFRGRYKSVLVEEDSHLVELLRYIHRNPVRARICKSVSDYRWSSHHVYVSTAKKPDWLYTDFLLWRDY